MGEQLVSKIVVSNRCDPDCGGDDDGGVQKQYKSRTMTRTRITRKRKDVIEKWTKRKESGKVARRMFSYLVFALPPKF